MMTCRYQWLNFLVEGYARIGVPLIGFDGMSLVPLNVGDDIGMYYCIPLLAHFFNLSLDTTIYIFFYGILLCSCILGLTGLFLLYKKWTTRFVSVMGLLAISYVSREADVYLVAAAVPMAVIPLFLYGERRQKVDIFFLCWLFFSGIVIGFAHAVRSLSSLAVLGFIVVMVVINEYWTRRQKMMLVGAVCAGMALVHTYFAAVYNRYAVYAKRTFPTHQMCLSTHVFWHPIYLGFGFLNNKYGIVWDDTNGAQKVATIDPTVVYCSAEYETILKEQCYWLLRHDLGFVIKTIFAKIGVLFFWLLMSANIGLFYALLYRKRWRLDFSFFVALGLSSAFGVLVMPLREYLLGFIAFSVLYGIISINYALE